jgi:hypothetical protein
VWLVAIAAAAYLAQAGQVLAAVVVVVALVAILFLKGTPGWSSPPRCCRCGAKGRSRRVSR